MNRRHFLTRSGLALGALIVGDEAIEALARLTHVRKTFPSASVGGTDFSDWRYVQLVGDFEASPALITLQGSRSVNGPWTPLETRPMIGGTITFSRPYWMNAKLTNNALVITGP